MTSDTDKKIFSILKVQNELNASARTTTDKESAKLFKPPEFIHPYPVILNPHFSPKEDNEWARTWLLGLRVNTILDDKSMKTIFDMDVPRLCATFYPRAGEWGFRWSCKLIYTMFVLDDTADASLVGKEAKVTLSLLLDLYLVLMWSFPDDPLLHRELLPYFNILENGPERQERIDFFEGVLAEARTQPGTVYPGPLSTLGNVLRDLWTDAISHNSPPDSMLLVAQTIQDWLSGVLLETKYKHGRTVPDSVNDVFRIRKQSSAVIPAVIGSEIVLDNPLRSPAGWINSPEMQRMLDATNDIVTWHNDLWSFKREVYQGDHIFNMVLAVSSERLVTYEEAGSIVIQMLNERVVDLDAAAADLERVTPPDLRPNFVFYRESCQSFVSGTVYWHAISDRFR